MLCSNIDNCLYTGLFSTVVIVNPLGCNDVQKPVQKVEQKRVQLTEISDIWLQAEQEKDSEINSILTKLQNDKCDLAKTYVS